MGAPSPAKSLIALVALLGFPCPSPAATLTDARITEFLASNEDGIVDEDDDSSDWIEIWNTTGIAGDLGGWYLTDDPQNLTKWALPAVQLATDERIVVFASAKDRSDPNSELHTNFRINASAGGYLALVKPDGSTVASEFASYPVQYEDISYGSALETGVATTLVEHGDAAKWLVPDSPVPGWETTAFNDAAWSDANTGIGFDTAGDYTPLFGAGGDILDEMRGVNPTVYIRIPFHVADPTGIGNLVMQLKWEDGFVAHLNGTEFASGNAPADPQWDSTSSIARSDEDAAVTYFDYPVAQGTLVAGTNVLAIQGLNQNEGSSDLLIDPRLVGTIEDPNNLVDGYFPDPTPGDNNGVRYDGIVGDTGFSIDRGFYETAFDLAITTDTENAEIRYTTDGTPPTETSGEVYTGPISITGTTVVRAIAHRPGFRSTNVDTHTYIFPADIYGAQMVDALTAVPSISLVAQANYDLRLMSVAATGDLPSTNSNDPPESSTVVVALVAGDLHVRIIDVHIRRNRETNTVQRQIVIDKAEAALNAGQEMTDLVNLLNEVPFPDASALSPEMRREIIEKAISISDHNPSTPFLQDNNNDYIEHKGSIEMIFPDGTAGFQEEGGLSNFGGGFTNFAKKNFRVYFRSEYGTPKLRYPIFDGFDYENIPPVDEFDAINLRTGSHDMVNRGGYMAARFVDDSMLEMGNVAPHGRFVHVYLNGNYWGQYHLRERWNADMAASYLGGSKEDYDAISGNNSGMNFQVGSAYDGTDDFWNETRTRLAGPDPFVNAAGHIDIANVIDFMLLWTAGECESEFRAFGSQSQGVPFKFMVRDPDGYMPGGGWSHVHPVTHQGPINAMSELRTGGNPDYDILLADRIHKHFFNDGALTADRSVERLRRRFEEARPGFAAEAMRWNYRTVSSWEAYVNGWLNNGLPQRTPAMIQRLRQAGMYPNLEAPVFSQFGGPVIDGFPLNITNEDGLIYYTTDGSDPRLPGGAPNPSAAIQSGSVLDVDLVPLNSVWRFNDSDGDLGTAWRTAGYNDAAWSSGAGPLGYGGINDGPTVIPIATSVNEIQPRQPTSYFRKTFTIDQASSYLELTLRIRLDAGAVVYLNGNEAFRDSNIPAGATYATLPDNDASDNNEGDLDEYTLDHMLLVDGTNLLAVELHNSPGSSDMIMDLQLRARRTNPGAQPVSISPPATVRARSFDNGQWSALTEAFFSIVSVPAASNNLVVSEFNYHPEEPTKPGEIAISTDRDDYEFLEFLNIGAQPIDLSGVAFTDGITFAFPGNTLLHPGQRAVLVNDLEAFTERYGALAAGVFVGEFSGRLSNDGERVAIGGPGGNLIEFTYNDQPPWPTLPDGLGYSMVLVDPSSNPDHNDPASWLPGSAIGGGPGEEDVTLESGYLLWKSANNVSDDFADDDGDGIISIAEYAFGTLPQVPNPEGLPSPSVVNEGGQDYLAITYQKNLLATDVMCEVQHSPNLETWSAGAVVVLVSETANPDGETATVVWRSATPIVPGSGQYLRLQLSLAGE